MKGKKAADPPSVDVGDLVAKNPYVAAALGVAIDCHRDFQAANHPKVEPLAARDERLAAERGAAVALEAMAVAATLATYSNPTPQQAQAIRAAVKAYVWSLCGTPDQQPGGTTPRSQALWVM
jgi:hypothetical protein